VGILFGLGLAWVGTASKEAESQSDLLEARLMAKPKDHPL
jgi:hypothetical protein